MPANTTPAGPTLGGQWLRAGLVRAANAAARTKDTYLSAQYHRLAARRGRKRAIVAVAHSILVSAYHILQRQEAYQDLGGNYYDERKKDKVANRYVRRLEKLGYKVVITDPERA